MDVKLGICNFCVPGGGAFAPETVKRYSLDGMSIEFGPWQQGNPLSMTELQDLYLDAQQRYMIEYPNIGVSDGDTLPFHARRGSWEDELFDRIGKGAIGAASRMGIGLVFFANFGPSLIRTEEDLINTVRRYRYFCDLAGEKGINIACENPNTVEEQKVLIEMVDRSNFSLFFDTCNHHAVAGYDGLKCLRELYPYYTSQMHIKDGVPGKNASRILGTGTSGFKDMIAVLKENKYEGWLILENKYAEEEMRKINHNAFELLKEDISVLKDAVKGI